MSSSTGTNKKECKPDPYVTKKLKMQFMMINNLSTTQDLFTHAKNDEAEESFVYSTYKLMVLQYTNIFHCNVIRLSPSNLTQQ
jgi:hypothetical protein